MHDMRSANDIALTNAHLLARYGFVLEDGNANDGVSWNMHQLRKLALTQYVCDDAFRTRTGRDGGAGWRVSASFVIRGFGP
jgi:hypothetical protein